MWWWGLFVVAAGVAGFAVHRLYQRTQAEISTQAERAVLQARAQAEDRIRSYTSEVRRSIITELAGFHEDGLAQSLQRWPTTNENVIETFRWDAAHGLTFGSDGSRVGTGHEDLIGLWTEFRAWRTSHPGLLAREPVQTGPFRVLALRTLDNPALPAATLRYQGENLDLLADAKLAVDPWAGWAAKAETPPHWIFWYQAGPDAAVRGGFVSVEPLLRGLRREIAGGEFAHVRLEWPRESAPAAADSALPGLPGYQLTVEPGDLFQQKAAEARFDALIAAALLGLFLLGGAALTIYSRRAAHDAGRKITFVTQVSHELRTPLTSIRMFADLLAAPGLPEEKRLKFAGTIGAESSRLSALIERLLAFNALEQGGRPVACGPLDVSAVVREVTEEMKPTLTGAGLQPVLTLPAAPAVALGDHSTLKQALLNLLDNSCKYARDSGPLTLAVVLAGGQVVVRIGDRGPGIPAAVRARLFEPFVQGGGTLTTKSPGVGLGLSLARGLLRQTGANLALEPEATGTTFTIRLPSVPAPAGTSS